MSKNSNTEGKGFVLKMRFILALIKHNFSDDSLFSFSKHCLFSEKLATIIRWFYNLDGTISIMSDKIVDTMSNRRKHLHAKYGIYGVLLSHSQSNQQIYSDMNIKSMEEHNGSFI